MAIYTLKDLQKKYGTDPFSAATSATEAKPVEKAPGYFDRLSEDFAKRREKNAESAARSVAGQQTVAEDVLQNVGQIAGGVGDIVGEGINSAIAVTPEAIKKPVADYFTPKIKAVMEDPVLNQIFDLYKNLSPRAKANIDAVVNIGSLIPAGKAADVGVDAATNAARAVIKETPIIAGEAIDATKAAAKTAKNTLTDRAAVSVVKDWQRVGDDFAKTGQILERSTARGKDIPTFLTEHKISPGSVLKDGQYATDEAADTLTRKLTQPLEDVLDQQLIFAEQETLPVVLNDLETAALSRVSQIPRTTAGQQESIAQGIRDEIAALRKKYGDTIKLTDLNKEKRTYWSNTKFDSTKPFQGDSNYQLGRAMKETIQKAVPEGNVADLNNLLGDYYESGKFLRALDGKRPKLTKTQKVGRALSRTAGIGFGSALGGIGGGATGYFASLAVNYILENADDSIKALLLNNLSLKNPKAYDDAVKYLGRKEAERLATPLLPEASELGTTKNPIIPAAPTTYEPAAQNIAPRSTYNPVDKKYYTKGKVGGGNTSKKKK